MSTSISRRTFAAGLVAATALTLAACGSSDDKAADTPSAPDALVDGETKNGDLVTIAVGCSPVPHAKILQFVQDNLAEAAGISLDIKEISDYVTPNTALDDGSLAANFFQTPNYLKQQIKDNGFAFVSIADVHVEPLGLYSNKYDSVEAIPEGSEIALNNDPANTARALLLLQSAGLIKLDDAAELPSETDITENPKNLKFTLVEGAQTPRALDDVAAAVINGNFAIEAGKIPSKDALFIEPGVDSPYANELVVREADKNNEYLLKLAELLNSDDVKKFIEETWTDGSVIPAF
ncbi:MetQ/NlpA family ABC transporter substrate-binding protein [Actinomyces vulturis]|uniref:MetQ/NlpA family ABC transporter substrate-binding protein n=1 Tax=Actinomyces vulturis TaxID=1857645 RepID=UPI00082D2147|nr:MetQ/NlpA family ABC transporter substrate-binding protein [Actinomyces vulturis]